MKQENATKGPARNNSSFTPLHNPARHEKVPTTLADYIENETLEWYEEVHRVAANQGRSGSWKKKRMEQNRWDREEQEQVREKVQQTHSTRHHTLTKKQNTTKGPIKRKWKNSYLNKEGNTRKLIPTLEPTVTMTPILKRKKQYTAWEKRSSTLKMVCKVGAIPTYEMY